MLAIGLLLALAIGGALGALGSGGSILALPMLVYVLRVPPTSAVPMSMVIVGLASIGATFLKWRQGAVNWRAWMLLSSTGVIGAYLGSGLTHLFQSSILMMLFASILLGVGILMLRNPERRLHVTQCQISRCLAAGALVGLLTGFLGVGGGFLLVPTLILFAGLDLKSALGTSVGIISVNSMAGILGHLRFAPIDWKLTGLMLGATVLGVVFGVAVAKRLPEEVLRRGLAAVMIIIGLWTGGAALLNL